MEIYLVRHGRALSVQIDPEKGLSPEGVEEVKNLTQLAIKNNVRVTSIKHSGKKRAINTANILAEGLQIQYKPVQVMGLNPEDNMHPWIAELELKNGQMLVGHNPFMEILCAGLRDAPEESTVRFNTANMVCLTKNPEDRKWKLKWKIPADL